MKTNLRASIKPFVCSACRNGQGRAKFRRFASESSQTSDIYDVVTIGGGPVGLALLAALKSSPVTRHLKTTLIETQDLSKATNWELPLDQYSNRASSLTPASVSFLEESGAWQHVDQSRIQPYGSIQVWDAANESSIHFDWKAEAEKYNAPPRTIAMMTENANLTRGILRRIHELGADDALFSNTRLTSIANGVDEPNGLNLSSWPKLSLSNANISSLSARLLVGADGFNSPVRDFAGIGSKGWDYNRHGVVATLTTEAKDDSADSFDFSLSDSPPTSIAYQRFLPSLGGPIALLPLPDNHASLVWSTTAQNAAYLKTLPNESLVALINAAFRLNQTDIQHMFRLLTTTSSSSGKTFSHSEELNWRLEHTPPHPSNPPMITSVQPSTLASFPLRLRHAESYIAPRIALIGDAAHTIHPLAGQGLNLGLADAKSLAETISYAVQHGQDLGDLMTLERYNQDRWGKNLSMMMGVDGLAKLYEMGGGGDGIISAVMGRARGLGMSVMGSDAMSGVRSWIMRRAEG